MDNLTIFVRRVQRAFADNPERKFTARQMYKYLGIKQDRDKALVRQILVDMASQGLLREVREGKYEAVETAAASQHKRGKAPATADDTTPEVVTGTLILTSHGGVVCSLSDKQIRDNIIVRQADLHGAHDGDKVSVVVTRQGTARRLPEGRVLEVLGKAGDNDTEMHAILAEFGLPYAYPEQLEDEANTIADGVTNDELHQRHDMRERLTFTIDPADAKDFDDALSFEVIAKPDSDADAEANPKNAIYEVGVHIADVTYYVKPATELDREAYRRATSVYLVDRTIPMLPERLSNELCSLREGEEKLCMSVIMQLDEQAHVLEQKICRTVIRSDRRFNYEQVQDILSGKQSDPSAAMQNALLKLNDLAKQLRRQRIQNGALEFDREEMRFRLDDNGKPLSVYLKRATDANNLIEEFMLLANKLVAQTLSNATKNVGKNTIAEAVYRIHDIPDPDKLNSLSKFIRRFGYNLKTQSTRQQTITKNINALLSSVQGKPEATLVETLTIRSMAKAVYSTDNIGHYGLAFRHYTHFTSPIRRYPDMIVHRLLEQVLFGKARYNPAPYETDLETACQHCSEREQTAAAAERASIKYKQAEFLHDKIGVEFDGHISGVTEYGLYVQLDENHCEGMIPIRFVFDNDYAMFLEDEYCIEGERLKKRYQLGDAVRVTIVDTNMEKKQIDLALVSSDDRV